MDDTCSGALWGLSLGYFWALPFTHPEGCLHFLCMMVLRDWLFPTPSPGAVHSGARPVRCDGAWLGLEAWQPGCHAPNPELPAASRRHGPSRAIFTIGGSSENHTVTPAISRIHDPLPSGWTSPSRENLGSKSPLVCLLPPPREGSPSGPVTQTWGSVHLAAASEPVSSRFLACLLSIWPALSTQESSKSPFWPDQEKSKDFVLPPWHRPCVALLKNRHTIPHPLSVDPFAEKQQGLTTARWDRTSFEVVEVAKIGRRENLREARTVRVLTWQSECLRHVFSCFVPCCRYQEEAVEKRHPQRCCNATSTA